MNKLLQQIILCVGAGAFTSAIAVEPGILADPPPRDLAEIDKLTALPSVLAAPPADEDAGADARLGPAVAGDRLRAQRGKADTVTYQAQLGGVVSGNSASNMATGANTIDAGSFAHMAGLPVVIQNSGANVLIQNSTIVNVQFK